MKNTIDKIIKLSSGENNLKEAERLANFMEASNSNKEPLASILKLLKGHIYFQQKEFLNFRASWTEIKEEHIFDSGHEKLIELYRSYCVVWQKNLQDLNYGAELEAKIIKSSYADFDDVYKLADLLENIDSEKAVLLLFKIIEKDRAWKDSLAVKKSAQIISRMNHAQLKSRLRKKLASLIN